MPPDSPSPLASAVPAETAALAPPPTAAHGAPQEDEHDDDGVELDPAIGADDDVEPEPEPAREPRGPQATTHAADLAGERDDQLVRRLRGEVAGLIATKDEHGAAIAHLTSSFRRMQLENLICVAGVGVIGWQVMQLVAKNAKLEDAMTALQAAADAAE